MIHSINNPLPEDHFLVLKDIRCSMCGKPFYKGQRTTLLSANSEIPSTVQAIAVHANCAFEGVNTKVGKIKRIKDGDSSPYPVVTTEGQYTLSEAGLNDV